MHLLKFKLVVFALICSLRILAAEPDTALAFKEIRIGTDLIEKELYDSALVHLMNASQILKKTDLKDDLANVCIHISECHYERNDCGLDLLFIAQALDLKKDVYGNESSEAARVMHDMGLTLAECDRQQEAFDMFDEALRIFKKGGAAHEEEAASVQVNIGWLHGIQWNFEEALVHLLEGYETRKRILGSHHKSVGATAHIIGYNSIYAGKYDQAEKFVRIGLEIRQQTLGPYHHETVQSWQKLGEVQLYQRKFSESLPYFQKALAAFSRRPEIGEDIALNPKPNSVRSLYVLRQLLSMKSSALTSIYEYELQDTSALRMAGYANQIALEASDRMLRDLTTTESRLGMLAGDHAVTKDAIRIAKCWHRITGERQYLNRVLNLMERSRNHVFRLSMQDEEAKELAGLPEKVLVKEKSLAGRLDSLEYELTIVTDEGKESKIRTELIEVRTRYDSFIEELKNKHPNYHKLQYERELVTVDEVASTLDHGELMISYFESDYFVDALSITTDTTWITSTRKPAGFGNALSDFVNSVRSTSAYASDPDSVIQQFASQSFQLYKILLEESLRPDSTFPIPSEIIILPDGPMSYLPFELLAVSDREVSTFQEMDLLIAHANVSYSYSADPHFTQHEKMQAKNPFVAFAANYSHTGSELQPLPGAKTEVSVLTKLLDGKSVSGETLTKKRLIEMALESQVVHLAMHTIIDDERPSRSRFAVNGNPDLSEQLLAFELLNLKLNSDLAVLSGCETGTGKLARGEGVMSLSRAFAYAGCPSILMSLWKTDDQANRTIIEHFYAELKAGSSKSEALRTAKLSYLNTADALSSHPSYWAAFVVVGTTDPINFNRPRSTVKRWTLLAGIAAFVIVISVVRRFQAYG